MKKLLLLTTILSMAAFAAINAKITFIGPLKKTGAEGKVIFLEDAQQKKFILKQNHPELAIRETLATRMAQSAGININDVELLELNDPIKKTFFGTTNVTATLHTHVPGEEVYEIREQIPYTVDIKKGIINNYFSSPSLNISCHKDLCEIAAANTYVNNKDAHNSNLFFDAKTNTFHAIDMDFAFLSPASLATKSCSFVEKLTNEDLSLQEVKSLKRFDKTLEKLSQEYPAEKIYTEWMDLKKTTGYEYTPSEQSHIQTKVTHNLAENKRLQATIKAVLESHRKSQNPISYAFKRAAEPSKKAQHDFWRTMNS